MVKKKVYDKCIDCNKETIGERCGKCQQIYFYKTLNESIKTYGICSSCNIQKIFDPESKFCVYCDPILNELLLQIKEDRQKNNCRNEEEMLLIMEQKNIQILIEQNLCVVCKTEDISNINLSLCKYCYFTKNKINICAKEIPIYDYLLSKNYDPIHNNTITLNTGKRARPDFLLRYDTHIIIIEVDEHQHKAYPEIDELARMINIMRSINLPTWFIRYNPDKYKKTKYDRARTHENAPSRRNILGQWIEKCKNENPRDHNSLVKAIYLFYDGWSPDTSPVNLVKINKLNKWLPNHFSPSMC
jgi:hypothetical protein